MPNKTKELRSRYHAAPKPKPILTLFGIEYDLKGTCSLFLKAIFSALGIWIICLGVYLCA